MIRHSRIPDLKSWIEQIASPGGRSTRQKFEESQLEINRGELIDQLESIAAKVKNDHQRLAYAHEARIQAFEATTTKLVSTLRSTLKRIDTI